MLDPLRSFTRYARGLKGYLQNPLAPDECRRIVAEQLEQREPRFLRLAERGIFGRPRSPYRWLLERAGIGMDDLRSLVEERGLEDALGELHDAGVRVTLDEFKGRRPLERDGRTLQTDANDFDNPFLTCHYEGRTSGSRGTGRRILIDLDLLAHEAAHHQTYLEAFGLTDRPVGVWYPVPPGSAGMKAMLRYAKLGHPPDRWFSPWPPTPRHMGLKRYVFMRHTLRVSRALRLLPIPRPETVRLHEADRIARWLADMSAAGTPALMQCTSSGGARITAAARQAGLDISGTHLRLGGEPYTAARERMIQEAGCTANCHYSMAEIGLIGIACASPVARDDVHVLTDKIAVVARPMNDPGEASQGASTLHLTTLHPSTPKIMLNVESGDDGLIETRRCGCPIGRPGLSTHLRTIRCREKLTSGGMSFLGSDLLRLVEEILPGRFGGAPTHYQLVEEETPQGKPRISVIVSPQVGPVDDDAVVRTIVDALAGAGGAQRMMAELWREGRAFQVVRREPYTTGAKIQALHVMGLAPFPTE